MIPFLQQVATLCYNHYGEGLRRVAFVFPNRRAGLFFRKYLSQAAGKPIFAPAILTVDGLFMQLSGKAAADHLGMLFMLYRIYSRRSGVEERFDDFVFWGEMLLKDFDDVDRYLVDARSLFTNVSDLHGLDGDLGYLSREQVEAIRAFWSSFRTGGEVSEHRRRFLHVWELLYDVYVEFRAALAGAGQGYGGMIFREVVERIEREGVGGVPYDKIIFTGLNALSAAETRLLQLLAAHGRADFYWDCGSKMLLDPHNRASHFVIEHLKRFPSALPLPPERHGVPEIDLIGVPSATGQAKYVHTLLREMLGGRMAMDPEEALRTAIVLPDERLLVPVLNSIPEEIEQVNITLGYPLSGTPVASLVESILLLHKNARFTGGRCVFYHRDVLPILAHQYIRAICGDGATAAAGDIAAHNRIYVDAADLGFNRLLAIIFSPPDGTDSFADYLAGVLQALNGALSALRPGEAEEDDPCSMHDLEQEFVYHYFTVVNRMKSLVAESGISMTADTCFRLLKRIADTITIPFSGEPLSGLQIMGVLETRVLDFDRLIILSMNEGIFPARTSLDSFIPGNLRRGFGLPAFEYQDSMRAYHFYRLIARAKHVTLLYDTRTEGLRTGEVSRFVHQLRYHYNIPVRHRMLVYHIASSHPAPLRVEKSGGTAEKLSAFLLHGNKALSASAINTYLDCPLKFYFTCIEEMKEEEEVTENIENRTFGNILHKALELLYHPFCGTMLTADLLKIASDEASLTEIIARAFAEACFRTDKVQPLGGQHYLTGEIIRKYVLKILEHDARMTPFRYIGSEKKMQTALRLTDGREVRLKGFIDRIDEADGALRIADYKTGIKKPLEYKTMEALFDPADPDRPSAVMQVFTYAWMYGADDARPVRPVVYYVRDLFSTHFDPAVYYGKEKTPVDDFTPLRNDFEACLRTCLDEMMHAGTPFVQTADDKPCRYCPYAGICGRESL
ncbi:MAG: PD-(D/E)XK nuclease family protein [Tannerella sp.]|jgi:hypothetical protein|nr:PD-(D/E)XK nuclease family protein [Tannerella sp.]